MRKVQFHEYGGPSVLTMTEADRPEPAAGELLIEVAACGVTLPVVRLSRAGNVPLPYAPGGEVAGRVVGIGAGVTGWQLGQRATGLAFAGAYAEFATVPAALLTPIPENVDEATALALQRNGCVALGVTQAAGIQPGETVLVTAAASGIGHLAVQLAGRCGATRVLAAVSDIAKGEFLPELGAAAVLRYDQIDAGEQAEPVHVVLDGVGGEVQAASLRRLAPFGRLVDYNATGGPVDTNQLRMHSQSVIGFAMANFARLRPTEYARHQQQLWDLHAEGQLRPIIDRALPLARAAEAHRLIEARENRGKIILLPQA